MNTLTNQDMLDAVFARACNNDPDGLEPVASAACWATAGTVEYSPEFGTKEQHKKEVQDAKQKALARLKNGQKILGRFTMKPVHRSTVHTLSNGNIPGQDEGEFSIRVESGHIANSQAYTTYVFKRKS